VIEFFVEMWTDGLVGKLMALLFVACAGLVAWLPNCRYWTNAVAATVGTSICWS
jgi:hypothetical protein